MRKCASTLLNAPQWEAVEYGWGLEEPVVVRMEEECHCEDAKAVELLPDQPNLSGMSKEEKKAFMRKEVHPPVNSGFRMGIDSRKEDSP